MQSPRLNDGDLWIDHNDLVLVEGTEELAQCCEIVLGTNQGEWFLNPSLGIDFSKLNGKMINQEEAKEEIRKGLRQEIRIKTIDEITVNLDTKSRESLITFTATSEDGEVVSSGTGQ